MVSGLSLTSEEQFPYSIDTPFALAASDRGVAIVVTEGILLHQEAGDTLLIFPSVALDQIPASIMATEEGFLVAWTEGGVGAYSVNTARIICQPAM